MTLQELVYAVIESGHGTAVADQFKDSFESGDFKRQNPNALSYIKNTVSDLLESGLLDEREIDDLLCYYDEITEYVNQF
jgi:hypothetical protein